jgi:hypothetical protein
MLTQRKLSSGHQMHDGRFFPSKGFMGRIEVRQQVHCSDQWRLCLCRFSQLTVTAFLQLLQFFGLDIPSKVVNKEQQGSSGAECVLMTRSCCRTTIVISEG